MGVTDGAATTTVELSAGNSIENCNIRHIHVTDGGTPSSGISIVGNTFDPSSWSDITLSGFTGSLVQNNTGHATFDLFNSVSPTFEGNNFVGNSHLVNIIGVAGVSGSLSIINNVFTITDFNGFIWHATNVDLVFNNNTVAVTGVLTGPNPVIAFCSGNLTMNGNYISVPYPITNGVVAIGWGCAASAGSVVEFHHNTVVGSQVNNSPILFRNSGINFTANITYNMVVNTTPVAPGTVGTDAFEFENFSSDPFSITNDYNGTYGFGAPIFNMGSAAVVAGAHDQTDNPHLRTGNASTSDDLYPAPWSDYLDVNGSLDIGAYSGPRRSTVYVSEFGTIDYSSVDATSTLDIITTDSGLKNGDTVQLAAGSYTVLEMTSSTRLTSGLTINGVGSGITGGPVSKIGCFARFVGIDALTFSHLAFDDGCQTSPAALKINSASGITLTDVKVRQGGGDSVNGLSLEGVSNSTFTNLDLSGFTTSSVQTVQLSNTAFRYSGIDYNEGASIGSTASSTLILKDGTCSPLDSIGDGTSVTAISGGSTNNWNVYLGHISGAGNAHITFWAPNNLFATGSSITAVCGGYGVVEDLFIPNVLTYSAGTFTYNASAVASAGASIISGFDSPASMNVGRIYYGAGLALKNSADNVFTTVTSTGNTCGVMFAGNSGGNVLNNFLITSSGEKDLCGNSYFGTSIFNGPQLTAASIEISGSGTIDLRYRTRAHILDQYSAPVSGTNVTIHDALSASSTVMATNISGYTSYSDYFTSIVLSSSATGNIAGGYNPFVISAAAIDGLYASSTSGNLIAQNQTFTLYMSSTSPVVDTPCSSCNGNSSNNSAVTPSINSFLLDSGASSTISTMVHVLLLATSSTQMVLSEDAQFAGAILQPYTMQPFTYIFKSAVAGIKKLYAKVVSATNTESAVVSQSIIFTTSTSVLAEPQGSVSIADKGVSGMTSSTHVILNLAYSSGVTQMMISNTEDFVGTEWQAVAQTKNWTLSHSEGKRVVYVKFKDASNGVSPIYSASTILDTIAPAKPIISLPGDNSKIYNSTTTISGTADVSTHVAVVLYNGNNIIESHIVSVEAEGIWSAPIIATLGAGSYHIAAYAIDAVGNVSSTGDNYFTVLIEQPKIPLTVMYPTDNLVLSKAFLQARGTAEPNSKIIITRDDKVTFFGKTDSFGSWKLPLVVASKSGVYSFDFKAFDADNILLDATQRSVELAVAASPDVPPTISLPPPNDGGVGGAIETTSTVAEAQVTSTPVLEIASGTSSAVDEVATSSPLVELPTVPGSIVEKTNSAIHAAASSIRSVQKIANKPSVQVTNQAIVVPAAAVVVASAVGGTLNFAELVLYFRFLFTQPLLLLSRKRRKGWGMAYNAFTKMPADLALVRIIDKSTGKVVQSQMTDRNGRYQFLTKPGEYVLEVSKPNFTFPAQHLVGRTEDGKMMDLYTGGLVHTTENAPVSYNLPLDPGGVSQTSSEILKDIRKKRIANILGAAGLGLTAVSFIISPTVVVGAFFAAHVVSYAVFRRLALPRKPKTWATITDAETGAPIGQAIVRVFDTQYNKLLDSQVTDAKGRYSFLVGENQYYLMVEKMGYAPITTEAITIGEVEGGSVLAKNLQIAH